MQKPPKRNRKASIPEEEHTEYCEGRLDCASTKSLLDTLAHIMNPIIDKSGSVTYDVHNCSEIDPGAVLLFCYAYELSQKQGRRIQIRGMGEVIEELKLHFDHYQLKKQGAPITSGLYPLRRIESKESMLTELEKWADSVRKGVTVSEEQVALWQMQIAEVTTNAFQHGVRTSITNIPGTSLVAGKASGDTVQLAALDFGSTIPNVISDVAKQHRIKEDDGELIEFACKQGITSQCVKQNQGAGLYSLVQTVTQSTNGILHILSRNGVVFFQAGKAYPKQIAAHANGTPAMDGTLTIINLGL